MGYKAIANLREGLFVSVRIFFFFFRLGEMNDGKKEINHQTRHRLFVQRVILPIYIYAMFQHIYTENR